ncbi:MAG: hypothetical protein AB7W47_06690 [Calditrichaceae bacterium]
MKKISALGTALFLFTVALAQAQITNTEGTLFHTQSGKTIEKGTLVFTNNMNFYTTAGEYIGSLKPDNFKTKNYWLVAGNLGLNYGITNHFDVSLGLRVYQDTHYSNEYNLPDDLFLTLKLGSFASSRNHFYQAFSGTMRFPTGEIHNYPFEEFASGAIEFGFLWAASYFSDPYLPKRSFSLHFNMGWWSHNEAGTTVYEYDDGTKLDATVNSNELRLAMGAVYPTNLFDYRVELSGIIYITDPDRFVYSAEEWSFLTPSIRYKPFSWATFDLGVDIRLSPERQFTSGVPDLSTNLDLPGSYPPWKVQMGANFNLGLFNKRALNNPDYERREYLKKIELIETVIEEQEKAEKAQKEFENLKKVRKSTDKELEDLKNVLE